MPRVLTVDDSRAIRMIVSKVVKEMGLEVAEAEDGEKGLVALQEGFDLVILDVTMPVLDGPGMLGRMREMGNTTPVLMLTSESKSSIVSELMKLKIEDYILKPFKNDQLVAKIVKILKKRDPSFAVATGGAAAAPAGGAPVAAAAPVSQSADILVVDDMENVPKKLRTMIPEQLTLASALSGQAGLKMARENAYKLILIDRELPDMPGAALVKQLRVLQPEAVCIAITLRSANNIVKECKDEGFNDVLFKPFSQDTIDDLMQTFFQTSDLLLRQENVLIAAAYNGRPDRVGNYYARITSLVKDAIKDVAEACFESVILDASKLPADPSRMAQMITELETLRKTFGLSFCLVGPAAVKRALANFEDTRGVRVVESLNEAQEMSA